MINPGIPYFVRFAHKSEKAEIRERTMRRIAIVIIFGGLVLFGAFMAYTYLAVGVPY